VLANVLVANNLRLPILSPLPIPSREEVGPRLERAAIKVGRLAGWIHRQERHVEGAGGLGRLLGISQRLVVQSFEALVFKDFFADETCTRCGWCVRHCPVRNIELTPQGARFGITVCSACVATAFVPIKRFSRQKRQRIRDSIHDTRVLRVGRGIIDSVL
jgi:ferredoxin